MKITVKVKTKTSRNKLAKNEDGTYTAHLTAAPVDGAANEALRELLSGEFDVAKSLIRIVKGVTSKNKIVSIGE